MLNDHFLSTQDLAHYCKAAGDALRMDILKVLSLGSFGVLELAEVFDVKQSGMSHHLKVLSSAGLVSSRREGNSIFYRCAPVNSDEALYKLKAALLDTITKAELQPQIEQGLELIYKNRSLASRQFFIDNASKFEQQQELIASFTSYGPAVAELIDHSLPGGREQALEVGPGTGEFLPHLAKQFQQVHALDNSSAMLELAQANCRDLGLSNIHWHLGDTQTLRGEKQQFDCAVINMVLHHTPAPAQIFSDVAKVLKPGASVFISELCLHDQDWVKDACGDLWMGFSPDELDQWAKSAGLEPGQSSYLALRNGFQIQIKQFNNALSE